MTSFARTTSVNTDFRALVVLLDADLQRRDGDEHAFYAQFNAIQKLQHVIVWYIDNMPVACGAFKQYTEKSVEIKRMFVLPEYRGQGLGFMVLKELEKWAAELNYIECILETGKQQPEAISLYQRAGYSLIQNYGQYENVVNSICMSKAIG